MLFFMIVAFFKEINQFLYCSFPDYQPEDLARVDMTHMKLADITLHQFTYPHSKYRNNYIHFP